MFGKISFLITLFLSAMPVLALADTGPSEVMQPAIEQILVFIDDEDLKGDANLPDRRAKIMKIVNTHFDYHEMSKRVLGRQWRKISSAEKDHFASLFSTLLEYAYIGKVESYSGNVSVQFTQERIKKNRAEVKSIFHTETTEIPVSYIMIKKEDAWNVYDVVIEGVSLVRNYMEQFKPILRKEKYAGLVKQIEDKVHELKSGTAEAAESGEGFVPIKIGK